MKDNVEKHFIQFYGSIRHKRRKVNMIELEEKVIKFFPDRSAFEKAGGYLSFYRACKQLEEEGIIQALKKGTNGRYPELPTFYWLESTPIDPLWSEAQMLYVSDRLDMSFYRSHPEEQTEEEWKNIQAVYSFLKQAEFREIVSREERSLELFEDEKFLSKAGQAFLNKIGLKLEDL